MGVHARVCEGVQARMCASAYEGEGAFFLQVATAAHVARTRQLLRPSPTLPARQNVCMLMHVLLGVQVLRGPSPCC